MKKRYLEVIARNKKKSGRKKKLHKPVLTKDLIIFSNYRLSRKKC